MLTEVYGADAMKKVRCLFCGIKGLKRDDNDDLFF
jgi:hypothetical protein